MDRDPADEPTYQEEPPVRIRSWQAHEEGELTPSELVAPPALEAPPVDEPPVGIKHKLHHELLAQAVRWFAMVPWESCERAWQSFAGTLPQLVRTALVTAATGIRAMSTEDDLEESWVEGASRRLYIHTEQRDSVVFHVDPGDFELIAWFLHTHVDGGDAPTASRVVTWALERYADDPTGEKAILPEPEDWPRPERELWSPPPIPADAVAREKVRSFFAELAERL